MSSEHPPTIEDLFPTLSKEEQAEAEENLLRYLKACLRTYEALRADPKRYAHFQTLTKREARTTLGKNHENEE